MTIDLTNFNMDDLPDGPPTIPAAEYHMKIVDCTAKKTQNADPATGRPGDYFNYRAVVQSGEHAGESIFGMWSLKEKQIWQFKRDLKRLELSPEGTLDQVAAAIVGVEGFAKVKETVRKDRETRQPDPELGKENSIASWIGPV
ncbi:MAG TPA: hypothetical protein VMX15_00135 [Candidatus Heimdallarchaeota archaeon]|nr:hypothetical protein [Candidatus Heimdallarchaeota archaeon]